MENDILAMKEKIEDVRRVVMRVGMPRMEGRTERSKPRTKIGLDIVQ